jgi:HK97 family phage portal protein
MGVLARVKEQRSLASPDARLLQLFGVTESASGIAVSETSALALSAWWACIQVISEDVAGLPLLVYERLSPKGKERAMNHPLYSVLHDEPNPEMTAFTFWQCLTAHICSWGNSYAEIEWGRDGHVKHLWPLRPDHCEPDRRADGSLWYNVYIEERPGDPRKWRVFQLPAENILHMVGLGFDGLKGKSPTAMARESIGLGLATEKYGSVLFKNQARPGGYLKHPATLSDEAQKRLIASWEERQRGLDNAHRIAVLEEGMEFQEVGVPPEDVEFIVTRQHQVEEICRWHRMQPHKIQHLLRSTYSNIEHQSLEHWGDTIQPYCLRNQQEVTRKCLTPVERKKFFVEYLPDAILRMDTKARYDVYAIGKQWGILNTNDIHDKENMNPVPGGDVYLSPLNMVPVDSVKATPLGGEKPPAPPASPAPKAARALPETRSGEVRRRLSEAYRAPFEQAFTRIIRRERDEVLKGALDCFTQRDQTDFVRWAREFYAKFRENWAWTKGDPGPHGNELWGLYASFSSAIGTEAAAEIGATFGMTPELEVFMRDYVQGYVDRHIGVSMASILEAIGQPDGDPLELLKLDLDKWDSRPAIDAEWEAHRAANAVARETWIAQGITKFGWQTNGDNCPYCNSLAGKIVGMEGAFAVKGEHLNDPDNPENWMSFSSNIYHPPAHSGCDCQLIAIAA